MEFNYLREKRRMLDSLGRTKNKCYGVECTICVLNRQKNERGCNCAELETEHPEEATELIRKWSEEHPQKTILQDFLEKYPNAPLSEDGTPEDICPYNLGYKKQDYCSLELDKCLECWNRPLSEVWK